MTICRGLFKRTLDDIYTDLLILISALFTVLVYLK